MKCEGYIIIEPKGMILALGDSSLRIRLGLRVGIRICIGMCKITL